MFQSFNRLSAKVAKILKESDDYGVNNESTHIPHIDTILNYTALYQLLPYQSFNPETGIFHNRKAQGFLIEAIPLLGANEEIVQILTSLITDTLPPNTDCQFMLWASPKIGDILDRFQHVRCHGEIVQWLSQKRVEFLREGAFQSLNSSSHYILRDFRLFISISMPNKKDQDKTDQLMTLRENIVSSFKSIDTPIKTISVDEFISVVSDILHPSTDVYRAQKRWNPYDAIAEQLIEEDYFLRVFKDKLQFENNNDIWDVRALSLKEYPESSAQWDMTNAIGKLFNEALQIPCSFIISLSLRLVDLEKAGFGAQLQSISKKKTAQSKNSDWMPKIFKEYEDWQYVTQRLSEGDRLVKTHFQVVLFEKEKDSIASAQKVHDLYRSNGWRLKNTKYLQLPSFLSTLPMMMSDGLYDDLKLLGRLKTITAFNAINIAPLQGEWKGTSSPHLILPGRRGQIATFNPFDNKEGNYNMAIAASSGKGKSVFIQEYIVSLVGSGGRVWVIDIGRSYEKTCKLLNGLFIEFNEETSISLNPFTFIHDFNASLSLLKPLLSAMAHPGSSASDEEITYLEKAAKAAWEEEGNNATITTVANWLQRQSSDVAKSLSHLLYSFTKDGIYAKYFEGKSHIDLNNPFVVLELQELKNKPDLQRIVFLVLMYQISEAMYLGDRSTQKSCIIDEAWSLLGGDNKEAAKFIAAGFRTARKHNANFVTSMQSVNDYFLNETSLASFENSDIKIILGQTSEAIDQLKRSERLTIDAYTERLFKSLRKTDDYSEVVIKTPSGISLHRIILDPFARILYSSKGEEVEAVKRLEQEGYSLKDAVEIVVQRRFQHG